MLAALDLRLLRLLRTRGHWPPFEGANLGVHHPSDVVAGALLGRALERLL